MPGFTRSALFSASATSNFLDLVIPWTALAKSRGQKYLLKNHLRVSKVDARMHQICSIFWPPPLASFWVVAQFTDGWHWCRELFWQPLFAQWTQVNCFGIVMPGIVLKVETVQDFLYEMWTFFYLMKIFIFSLYHVIVKLQHPQRSKNFYFQRHFQTCTKKSWTVFTSVSPSKG